MLEEEVAGFFVPDSDADSGVDLSFEPSAFPFEEPPARLSVR